MKFYKKKKETVAAFDVLPNMLHTCIRTYNDKAYTSPQLFDQFFNFRIFIKFFIYEVKKPSKF